MDRAREYREYLEQQQNRAGGIASDLQQLKADSGASAAELREFLSHLKGRSPQEVLGAVAESDLFRSILTAAVGCILLLVVLTIVPYALRDRTAGVNNKSQPAAAAQATEDSLKTATDVEPSASAAAQPSAVSPSEPDLERAAQALGIDAAEQADPQSNPLDSKLDKLLDGLE